MDHINGFKAAVAAVLGCLTALWGWFGWLVVAWVACMLLDYATGTARRPQGGEVVLQGGPGGPLAQGGSHGRRPGGPPSWTGCWA